ncbi:MAG: NUDIX domain-containing protein [Duncaniella sp.]|nr:NUDIX domain-containing protein [Duncaniella sp.]
MAQLANHHISIDCTLFGFDGTSLKVLLVKRSGIDKDGQPYADMKLPGSLIYEDEDLDEAAVRVLHTLTGVSNVPLTQFKAFGSKNRTDNPRDVDWLREEQNTNVERIITIAYFAILKLDGASAGRSLDPSTAEWVDIDKVGHLAFDHNLIIKEALGAVRRETDNNRSMLFDLLPKKFTASQLRTLCEIIYSRPLDVRNFHKKIAQMPYVVALEERQRGVAHRAARFYKFDRKIYNTLR